jgi:hypothetical protein
MQAQACSARAAGACPLHSVHCGSAHWHGWHSTACVDCKSTRRCSLSERDSDQCCRVLGVCASCAAIAHACVVRLEGPLGRCCLTFTAFA